MNLSPNIYYIIRPYNIDNKTLTSIELNFTGTSDKLDRYFFEIRSIRNLQISLPDYITIDNNDSFETYDNSEPIFQVSISNNIADIQTIHKYIDPNIPDNPNTPDITDDYMTI
jgi:hypothetical protein